MESIVEQAILPDSCKLILCWTLLWWYYWFKWCHWQDCRMLLNHSIGSLPHIVDSQQLLCETASMTIGVPILKWIYKVSHLWRACCSEVCRRWSELLDQHRWSWSYTLHAHRWVQHSRAEHWTQQRPAHAVGTVEFGNIVTVCMEKAVIIWLWFYWLGYPYYPD